MTTSKTTSRKTETATVKNLILALMMLTLVAGMATAQSPASAGQTAAQAAPAAGQTAAQAPEVHKAPQPKTQAEYDAFQAATALTDGAKLEAAATEFAQRFPESELRGYIYQQAMGQYQAAGDGDKALEMARAVLKYEPNNAVALLTAAQLLSERTHDFDLDRKERLSEADADARNALKHVSDVPTPAGMSAEQFAEALRQLRGTAHEVLGTVSFKRAEYFNAIKEFNAAVAEERERTDAVVYLRLAVANDKSDDVRSAMIVADKAIANSQAGSQVHQLAEQEKARLLKLSTPDLEQPMDRRTQPAENVLPK